MTLNCIIVDDEPIARDILRTYISQVPYLNLAGECGDAFEAMQLINKSGIDLVILDINMPRLSGLDMLRTLKRYPAIIITSAYSEYALEGFELSVTDYLLKPFSFPRFVQATEKVLNQAKPLAQIQPQNLPHPQSHSLPHLQPSAEAQSLTPARPTTQAQPGMDDFLMVKSDKKLTKVFFNDITHVEAYGNYIFIHCGKEKIMSKQTLTMFEAQLPGPNFLRIHKSFIASLKAVRFIEGNELTVGDKKLPVGKVYRGEVLKRLNK